MRSLCLVVVVGSGFAAVACTARPPGVDEETDGNGPPRDAAQADLDAGTIPDAAFADAASPHDAGASVDSGTPSDGGAAVDGASTGGRDPVVFVHGYLGHDSDWDAMKQGLVARGWSSQRLFAIQLDDTNASAISQAEQLATYVSGVLAQTGASRVDMVSHSLGGVVARLYVKQEGGGSAVRDYVSIAAPHHGNSGACFTTSFGDSSRQLCPAYASQSDSVDGVQWLLNGDPDSADVDETPFGMTESGAVAWNAIVYSRDVIVTPWHTGCLDQQSRGDCSAALNTVVDWSGSSHTEVIRDERMFDLVAERLLAH